MKKYNLLINIANIFVSLLYILSGITPSFTIYSSFTYIISTIYFIMLLANLILSIVTFIQKQIFIASGYMLIVLISAFSNWGHILIVGNILVIILSILNLVLNSKLENTDFKKFAVILFSIFIITSAFSFLTPIIMNFINIQNFENAILKMNSDMDTYIIEQANTYLFYNKKGKQINSIDKNVYGEIYLTLYNSRSKLLSDKMKLLGPSVNIYGKEVTLGVTKKGYILDTEGNQLFKLCNISDDPFSIYTQLLNYLIFTNPTSIYPASINY